MGSEVTRSSKSVTNNVKLSRFDAIKIELAVILGLVVGVLLIIWRLDLSHGLELALLAVLGFGAGGWLAARTRQAERDRD